MVLSEDVTFLNKAAIMQTLNHIPNDSKVIIDASKSVEIDQDVIEIIEEFKAGAHLKDIDVEVIDRNTKGMKKNPVRAFQKKILDDGIGAEKIAAK